jgi:hypothetical protein
MLRSARKAVTALEEEAAKKREKEQKKLLKKEQKRLAKLADALATDQNDGQNSPPP